MKKLAIFLFLVCEIVFAGPDDIVFQQRNSTDSAFNQRVPYHPLTNGVLYYDSGLLLPLWATLGSGLSINAGVLGYSQANADWNATSGASQILNKPSIPASQVNADWNANSGLAQILNKPSIPPNQVNVDWNSTGGITQILNKPSFAVVAVTGSYNDLNNKPTIPTATPFNFSQPTARTLSVSTSYQANDPTKAAIVTISPQCTAAITLTTGATCTLQARINSTTATCSTGTVVATWVNGNTGTLTIGLALNQTMGSPGDIKLPAGSSFILCPTSGTFTINNAVDQTAG